jgi:hypothetical protein
MKLLREMVLISSSAWVLAFSGCSSPGGAGLTRAETVRFLARAEQRKPENPRVHPGQPYAQEIWLDL